MQRSVLQLAAALFLVLAVAAAGCGSADRVASGGSPASVSSPATGGTGGSGTTLIDSEAILRRYGFEVCNGVPPASQVSAERGQAILYAAIDAGISQGGSPGGDGYKAVIGLFVLDDRSLARLAQIAQPSEACVTGQDPNDYVAEGPQALEGPGWHWIGAGLTDLVVAPASLVTDQAAYDRLWPLLGKGPETGQAPVDFTRQVIVTLNFGSGVNFSGCGQRFDGFTVADGTVVLDAFSPGGAVGCPQPLIRAVYAVALDLDRTGPLPLRLALRRGPRKDPSYLGTFGPGSFATTTTTYGPPITTASTAPPTVPPTAAEVSGTVAAGQRSAPAFPQRLGPGGSGAFDAPVPDGWETLPHDNGVDVHITGRGNLSVSAFPAGGEEWKAAIAPTIDETVVAGPTAVAVPLHRRQGNDLVTTGQTVTAQEYRYAATSFLRRTVRWYRLGDTVIVAVLGYPDRAMVPQSLTGIDPATLINDVRLIG